ncbi:hypothetical protein A2716_01510 [candidate division WWE3 bacterium RIFCSPHIGHO2_01_FULL_40_23]|uniref:Type II secretion system protein GspG C-terminal domain-containing protein n=1 Tax=candidate division WWE3 bacterium RIFCSPLOWO2_01_FULL_41_18 TaxID=1802625 RepID=A0A1F4VDZ3_UNCKA|nr:MAG: hypothetical protein A2716_01510 [candidate division WWE3 bacterium RIFCSPHIGHO2_01_FULL_40_23]OGC55407.1 MAG: hypothetical protein A3A78_00415 [candidate division WWE3 bacterium RIFCSPLOWO2_01_FULL_41_18]
MKKTFGFTLIELLLSVLLIVILMGVALVVINPVQVRSKATDSQRAADIKTIQAALERYYLRYRAYPASIANNTSTSESVFVKVTGTDNLSSQLLAVDGTLGSAVLTQIPNDPEYSSSAPASACTDTTSRRYNYWAPALSTSSARASRYVLTTMMSVPTSNDTNPCGSLTNWSGICGSFMTSDYCYGVEGR